MASSSSVSVVSRQSWGASDPKVKTIIRGAVRKVMIHHTALKGCEKIEDCTNQLTSIQKSHMIDRNFDDIGYNFLVAGDGTLFEGRGWGVVGAHTLGNNHNSVGISFMGNFEEEKPSPKALLAVKNLLKSGVTQGYLDENFDIKGHRDFVSTACPGKNLYAALPQLRSTT